MLVLNKIDSTAANMFSSKKVGVIPTDTIYGLSCLASDRKSVERIFKLKKRDAKKPPIVLIGKLSDLELLKIKTSPAQDKFLKKYWPGKISIVLDLPDKKYSYLHKGTKTLAVRMPEAKEILSLLRKTGPVISTSANPSGAEPAADIKQAMDYFGEGVDFYLDIGRLSSSPSTLVRLNQDGSFRVLRSGALKIKQA